MKAIPWRRIAMVALPVVLLIGAASAVFYTRLLQGPISLSRYVEDVEQGVTGSLTDLTARVGDVRLVLTDDSRLELQLINLVLKDVSGARVVAAPVASVTLNRTSLLYGQIVPARIQLVDPKLIVTYRKGKGVSLQMAERLVEEPQLVSEGERASRDLRPGRDGDGAGGGNAPALGGEPMAGPAQTVNLAQLISRWNTQMRKSRRGRQQLKEIGVRNASVLLDYEGRVSEWLIAEAVVDLSHGAKASTIAGAARVQSEHGPWVMSFRTVDSERSNIVRLAASVRDLVPASIADAAPELDLLKTLAMPVSVDATMQLAESGEVDVATLGVELAAGRIVLPELSRTPLKIEGCVVNLSYDGTEDRVRVSPSTLRWADSYLTIAGEVVADAVGSEAQEVPRTWRYKLAAVDGVLAAEEFGITGLLVDALTTEGRLIPGAGELDIDQFEMTAAGTALSAKGAVLAGADRASTRLDAKLTAKDLLVVKALWPQALAPGARRWLGENVKSGQIENGSLRIVSGRYIEDEARSVSSTGERTSLAMELADITLDTGIEDANAVAERALVRLENDVLEITIPEAIVKTANGPSVSVKPMRLGAVDLYGDKPLAEVALKIKAPLENAIAIGRIHQPKWFEGQTFDFDQFTGVVESNIKITTPLLETGPGQHLAVAGKTKIKNFASKEKIEGYTLKGGAIDIEASESALEGKGEILINGVPAKVNFQHILGSSGGSQPPVKVSMRLDNADRDQLELDINDVVDGEMPVTITITRRQNLPPDVHVRADLTTADLALPKVAWRKPAGQTATVDFELETGDNDRIELQNIRAVGTGMAIEGWAAIGADQRVREFYFPDFSIDTVTRLQMRGKLDQNLIWRIKAEGPTYDARKFFRSLLSPGDVAVTRPPARRPSKGVELDAKIENVIGGSGITLRNLTAKVSGRNDTLKALRIDGFLDNDNKVVALLQVVDGRRKLFIDSNDAGRIFKLAEFYPNMQGGRLRTEVNLDGEGAASKTGVIWVEDFKVLGDAVASEVVASAGGGSARRVTRQVFEFDRMRLPFSAGHDQFVIHESYLRGPVLGASIRGKVDYQTRRVNLGGTYIPLQGINSALCGIPLLGAIITGPKCEGVLGITFAVQGPMAKPQVIVNPLSMVAPGIFRDIFQLNNPSTRVTPRSDTAPSRAVEDRVRASSAITNQGSQGRRDSQPPPATIDGWTSE